MTFTDSLGNLWIVRYAEASKLITIEVQRPNDPRHPAYLAIRAVDVGDLTDAINAVAPRFVDPLDAAQGRTITRGEG